MANWGGGWLFSPDYLPTGEEIFATGAGSNQGDYSDPTNDQLIRRDEPELLAQRSSTSGRTTSPSSCRSSGSHLLAGEAEISNKIGGVLPINALDNLTPEYWYFKASS